MKKEHLNGLEILRYFLGVYIVLYHTMHYAVMPYFATRMVGMGFIASSTFFILSGFILSYVYLKGNGTSDVVLKDTNKNFLLKRFANLYPIHIFSLILTIIVVSTIGYLMIMEKDSLSSFNYVMYDSNNYTPIERLHHFMNNKELVIAFIMNALMIQSWNPYYLTFNAPAWSISTLFFMYILFPFIAPKLSKIKSPFKALFVTNIIYIVFPVLFISLNLFDMPYTGIINRNPLVRLPEFIAGILLCNIFFYIKNKGWVLGKGFALYSILFILLSFYLADRFLANPDLITKSGNAPYYLLHTGLLLIPECLLILLFSMIKINNEKAIHYLKLLGGASLPMFALHIPVYLIFTRAEYYFLKENSLIFYPLYLVIITLICIYFQKYIVVKTRDWILKNTIQK